MRFSIRSKIYNDVKDATHEGTQRRLDDTRAKNHINCTDSIQERKRCNRLVIILWRNTIPFLKLIEETNGDHFAFRGLHRPGKFSAQRHFSSNKFLRHVKPIMAAPDRVDVGGFCDK